MRILNSILLMLVIAACNENPDSSKSGLKLKDTVDTYMPDLKLIPQDKFGELVIYGRELMLHTAYYIGPQGIKGKYLGNSMNCTNCHQDAGTKPYSFNLVKSHDRYPQYRAREGEVLSLAERVNNCVMRPHSGIPLPLDSREMKAFLSWMKWINSGVPKEKFMRGEKNLAITFPERAADPVKGKASYQTRCQRCHGPDGEGKPDVSGSNYIYPPLWGKSGYQPGSSMHRIIKQAQWLKANMPNDSARWNNPILSDEEALDIAAYVNDDRIHKRPDPSNFDYPYPVEKAIDYSRGPYADGFSETQHKFGPYKPIIEYWIGKGMKPSY